MDARCRGEKAHFSSLHSRLRCEPMTAVAFPESFNLADYFLFDRIDEGLGAATAIRFGERSWTYAAVAAKTRAFASLLAEAGVSRGERVLIVLPDVPPFAWVFFG